MIGSMGSEPIMKPSKRGRENRPSGAGVPLATIGLLSELTLAYKFKFVWAPFLDQYDPPLVGQNAARKGAERGQQAELARRMLH